MRSLLLTAIPHIPLVAPGDDLAALLVDGVRAAGLAPRNGDVFVVAQKIVSKAEGRFVVLGKVEPSEQASKLALEVDKDPRVVDVILRESTGVVAQRRGVLVTEHRLGFVMANAGVDQSNIGPDDEDERVLMLPVDPDRSAALLKARLEESFGVELAVVINDSFGRPWRQGVMGVALGAAGLPALVDRVGAPDLFGRDHR